MAADEIYGTRQQCDELYKWCLEHYPGHENAFYSYDWDDGEHPIARFTTIDNVWLFRNCPFSFVVERIREQYGLPLDVEGKSTAEKVEELESLLVAIEQIDEMRAERLGFVKQVHDLETDLREARERVQALCNTQDELYQHIANLRESRADAEARADALEAQRDDLAESFDAMRLGIAHLLVQRVSTGV
jgi:enoyl-CoA hydratase/carnithine racemase